MTEPKKSIKRTILVTMTKEIEIELPPEFFEETPQDLFLKMFSEMMWPIDGIDGLFDYAARMAAEVGGGYTHDALGLLDVHYSTYPRVPDVKFRVNYEDTETEIIETKD